MYAPYDEHILKHCVSTLKLSENFKEQLSEIKPDVLSEKNTDSITETTVNTQSECVADMDTDSDSDSDMEEYLSNRFRDGFDLYHIGDYDAYEEYKKTLEKNNSTTYIPFPKETDKN